MTVTSFLAAHGVRAARYVTADGRIIFDNVTRSGATYTHPVHGTVTKVASHTFHDGRDPKDSGSSEDVWWLDTDALGRHVAAMETAFPSFTYLGPDESNEVPMWAGTIDTGRGAFEVAVALRRDQGLPRVAVLSRKRLGRMASRPNGRGQVYVPSPHTYIGGMPCIAASDDWSPTEHTAATATAWLAHWLAAYTEWVITGRWPVEGVHVAA